MQWKERLLNVSDGAIGAVALDNTTRVIGASEGVLRTGNVGESDLIGMRALDLVHPDDVAKATQVLAEVMSIPGDRSDGLYRLRHGDGSYGQYTLRATNLGPDGQEVVVLEFRFPDEAARSRAFADDVVDVIGTLSEDVDLKQSFDWVATVGERHVPGLQLVTTVFGREQNQVFSRRAVRPAILDANRVARADALPIHVEAALSQFLQGPWRASQKIATLDFIVPGRLTSILADQQRNILGYVEAFRPTIDAPDSSEWLVHGMISRMMTAALLRHQYAGRLRDAADRDPLTDLVNRRKLFELLDAERSLSGSMLYLIDLDRFSWVNNNLGHQAGDDTLVAVADNLRSVCPSDSVIARLGGDEFVVWVPAASTSTTLEQLGQKLSEAMNISVSKDEQRASVRASVGMVVVKATESAADALNRADTAMYASKRSGGDSATIG